MTLKRNCPICNNILIYKNKTTYNRAVIKNTKCLTCVGKTAKHDNFRGRHHTEESNRLKSEKMRGMGAGRKFSEETKKRISVSKKGHASRTGAVLSEETKNKIRESVTGFRHSDETKQKLRELTIKLRKTNPTRGISKSETKFLNELQNLLNINIERHYTINTKEYDGRYKDMLFEVDGEYWHNKEENKQNDIYIKKS